MIVVRVELWSAITGNVTELARAHISNTGGTSTLGNYDVVSFRGRDRDTLNRLTPQRKGCVQAYPRLALRVWNLVARALKSMRYDE